MNNVKEIANNNKHYTTWQAAKMLLITAATIIKYIKDGKISCVRTIGGHRRIPGTEINRIWGIMNKQ